MTRPKAEPSSDANASHGSRNGAEGKAVAVEMDELSAPPRASGSSEGDSLLGIDELEEEPGAGGPARHPLTFIHGLALIIGLQIGSGIFSAPSQISKHVKSPGQAILLWIFGGLLVWTGASCFIELGCSLPINGGFLFSWLWISITKPSSMAAISTVFANHLAGALLPEVLRPLFVRKLVALSAIWTVAYFNSLGSKTSANIVKYFMFLKFAALGSIIVFGTFVGLTDRDNELVTAKYWRDGPGYPDGFVSSTWNIIGELVTALFGALYCYGGWETVGFVAGEMQNPARDLPRMIHTSMTIVIVGFVLMNTALYLVLPLEVIRRSEAVTVTFGERVLGLPGSIIYGIVVAISSLGSLNSNTFSTARLCEMASKRGYLPAFFGAAQYPSAEVEAKELKIWFEENPRFYSSLCRMIAKQTAVSRFENGMPVYAMMLLAVVSSFYVIIGTFDGLIVFVGVSEYMLFFLATLGIFRLRHKLPLEKQPYRAWTSSILTFSGVSTFLVARGFLSDPVQGVAVVAVTGLAAFFFFIRPLHGNTTGKYRRTPNT